MTIQPTDIRCALFNDSFFPVVDGVVKAVNNYAKIINRTSYACVVAPHTLRKDYDDAALGYDVFRTSSVKLPIAEYSIPSPAFDGRIKHFLDQKKPDIVHAHSPFFEGTFAASYAKKRGIPSVATFHSKYYDDVINITGSKVIAKVVTKKIVRFYRSVDSVWSVSQGAADTLRSYGYHGDIYIAENGTDLTMPRDPAAVRAKAAAEFSIPQDKKVLLFVGHLIWHKNLRLVLDTFKMLTQRSNDYRLLIVGDGYDENEIRKYAKSLYFPDSTVRFLGKINDPELLTGVYLNADLLFFPSVYDTSGLVIREAATMGVPSLLTEGSNAAEAIEKNRTGFIASENKVAMYREILRIFGADGLVKTVGEAAREKVAKPWEQLIPKVQEKYAEIIEKYNFEHRQ